MLSLLSSQPAANRTSILKTRKGAAHLTLPCHQPNAYQARTISITNSEQTPLRGTAPLRVFPINSAALQRRPEAQPRCITINICFLK